MFKKIIFLLLFAIICSTSSMAYRRPVVIHGGGAVPDHGNIPIPADEPDVYHDTDTQEIIVDGDGTAAYYDVEIASVATWNNIIITQVNGAYDTIDVSSLSAGEYCITIYSPTGNDFVGFFLIE